MKQVLLACLFIVFSSAHASDNIAYEYKLVENGYSGQLIAVNVESNDIPAKPIFVSVLTVAKKNGHTCEFRGKENTAARITENGIITGTFNTIDGDGNLTDGAFEMVFGKNRAAITKAEVVNYCGLNGNPIGRWTKKRKL